MVKIQKNLQYQAVGSIKLETPIGFSGENIKSMKKISIQTEISKTNKKLGNVVKDLDSINKQLRDNVIYSNLVQAIRQ